MRLAVEAVVEQVVVAVEQEDCRRMFLALQPFQVFNTFQDY